MVQTAVTHVQPFSVRILFSISVLSASIRQPDDVYAIIIIGITISFAGNPRMKARRIFPSMPRNFPTGSRISESRERIVESPKEVFARIHIISPAGTATAQALPSTNIVRSNMERTITLPICGLRYGGSSRVNADGTPFRTVTESSHDARSVAPTPASITPSSIRADARERPRPHSEAVKNIVIIEIRDGKRPLQGTKLFVRIAIRRSRGESMMRQPVTPAALHPKPMHMDSIKPLALYAYDLLL